MGTSLADQVRNVEQENDALLSRVSTLEATNAILEMENARLVEQCDQLIRQNTDVRAMAEKLASDALDMLRAGRREVFRPANDPYAPKHQTAQVEKGAVREVRDINAEKDFVIPAGTEINVRAVGYGLGSRTSGRSAKEIVEGAAKALDTVHDGLIDFAKSGGPVVTNTPRAGESAEATAARSAPRNPPMRSADFLARDSAFDVSFVERTSADPRTSVMG